jgi:hypothetical protein
LGVWRRGHFRRDIMGEGQVEIWKQVPGCDGYEASTLGRIRGWWGSGGRRLVSPSFLGRVNRGTGGYVGVRLRKAGRRTRAHSLVLETFVGPCPDGMECCHENGVRTDNRLENLRWGTPLDNGRDRVRHGTQSHVGRSKSPPCGILNPNAKLQEIDVTVIRENECLGVSWLSERFGVKEKQIRNILTRRQWRHVA